MADAQNPKAGIPVWLRIVLVVSLALNLLIAGLIVGATLGDRRDGRDRSVRDLSGTPFFMALEPQERRALARAARSQSEDSLRESRRALRERFEALLNALRAESFDRGAVEALLAEQRAAASRRADLGEQVLLDHLQGLGVEERRAYADRLDASLRRAIRR